MILRVLLLLLLVLSLFVELLLISFPLIFLFTYTMFAIERKPVFLVLASIVSLAGDAVLLNPLGSTLIAVCLVLVLIHLYSVYLGSKDKLVYVLFGMLGIVGYAIVFQYSGLSLLKWFTLFAVVWIIYRLIPSKYLSV